MALQLDVMIMSGVNDGLVIGLDANTDGQWDTRDWVISIGRREDCDIYLRHDTFISRDHGQLRLADSQWWLVDQGSKNGTFVEGSDDDDVRVTDRVPLEPGQLFRIGRTWLRIQPSE